MRKGTLEILRCPKCKGELQLQMEIIDNDSVIEGSVVCINCGNKYAVHNGIPRLYIPDDEIISFSNDKKYSEFTITPESIDNKIKETKSTKLSIISTGQTEAYVLAGIGWLLFLVGIAILISNIVVDIVLWIGCSLAVIALTLFSVDYIGYRANAKSVYLLNLRKLRELSSKQQLSEFDIRSSTEDGKDIPRNIVKYQETKRFIAYKGKQISSVLNSLDLKGKDSLNVGCGGELHKPASQPYFDRGYHMIGVDISEEYLDQFSQTFNTDAIQANSMALPFRSNSFDLIGFTDIVEHLHNPHLGLCEAQRVLRAGGAIVLTTNNHCAISFRCINPFVFFEKLVGLYCDVVLTPRNILASWLDFSFYHTEFSKKEIAGLLKSAGFEILSLETQLNNKDTVNRILRRLPILKYMGPEFLIVAKKH